MIKNVFRKSLVIGIIILFIGASIISIASGINNNIVKNIIEEKTLDSSQNDCNIAIDSVTITPNPPRKNKLVEFRVRLSLENFIETQPLCVGFESDFRNGTYLASIEMNKEFAKGFTVKFVLLAILARFHKTQVKKIIFRLHFL